MRAVKHIERLRPELHVEDVRDPLDVIIWACQLRAAAQLLPNLYLQRAARRAAAPKSGGNLAGARIQSRLAPY